MKLAAERERKQREEALQLLAEQARTKIAATSPSLAGISTEIRTVPPTAAPPVADQPCDRDGAMLAQLRSNPSLEGIAQLEASLTCEKLRAQVMRLRESLSSVANVAPGIAAQVKSAIAEKIIPPPVVVAPPPPAAAETGSRAEAAGDRRRSPLRPWRRQPNANRTKPGLPRSVPIPRSPIWPRWSVSSAASGCARKSCGCARACPRKRRNRTQPAVAANPPVLQSAQSAPAAPNPRPG